jgi:hypothetical protein
VGRGKLEADEAGRRRGVRGMLRLRDRHKPKEMLELPRAETQRMGEEDNGGKLLNKQFKTRKSGYLLLEGVCAWRLPQASICGTGDAAHKR